MSALSEEISKVLESFKEEATETLTDRLGNLVEKRAATLAEEMLDSRADEAIDRALKQIEIDERQNQDYDSFMSSLLDDDGRYIQYS